MTGDERSPADGGDGDVADSTPFDPVPESSGDGRLSLDTVFELLSNSRRRFVLHTLRENPTGTASFERLVDDVAALEAARREEAVPDAHRDRVATDLHHWHLPVLEEVGVVTYDASVGIVQYHRRSTLETWAERARDAERSP